MKAKASQCGFTLIEMITVIAIILVLTSLIVGLYGFVQSKAAISRCSGEIAMIRAAASAYQVEYGSFPQSPETDKLKPTANFDPTAQVYLDANLHLYRELTGDREPKAKPDFQYTTSEEKDAIRFLKEFEARIVNFERDPTTKVITAVKYLQDPWGLAYGYSTSAISWEQSYQKDVRAGKLAGSRKSGDALGGFNTAEYDMWSTAGNKQAVAPAAGKLRDLEWAKWIKNW